MPNTFLNVGRTVTATSNPQANVQQVANNMQTPGVVPQTNQQAVQQPAQQNNQASNGISPITIPIQIQPITPTQGIAPVSNNNLQTISTNQSTTSSAPTPQAYEPSNTNNNVVDFDQIYESYQSQYGNRNTNPQNNNVNSGVKKTTIGSTIVTPTAAPNTVQGQYQSAYSDVINGLLGKMYESLERLESGNFYDPTQDAALRVASEYAANTTLQSLAGSGVLNSSATAERVARIVSELVPQYEKLAYDRQFQLLGQMADTAQLVMSYDSQQFEYWKDAKDREFQEKEFEFEKQQKELENAWKRVDELGYVDNDASALLGLKVGTLSKDAREAKEQREFELKKMKDQAELEYQNNKALAELRAELDRQQAQRDFEYDKQLQELNAKLNREQSQREFEYDKQLQELQSSLSRKNTEYEYQLNQKYGSSSSGSSSSSKTTSYSTYKDIIESNWIKYDDIDKKNKITGNNSAWYYIRSENEAGRMSDTDARNLITKYGLQSPVRMIKDNLIVITTEDGATASFDLRNGATRNQLLQWGKRYGVDLSEYI